MFQIQKSFMKIKSSDQPTVDIFVNIFVQVIINPLFTAFISYIMWQWTNPCGIHSLVIFGVLQKEMTFWKNDTDLMTQL